MCSATLRLAFLASLAMKVKRIFVVNMQPSPFGSRISSTLPTKSKVRTAGDQHEDAAVLSWVDGVCSFSGLCAGWFSGLCAGWFEGNGVSEGLELAYRVGLDGAGSAGGEVVRAGISVEVTVGEHAVRGDDHRPFNRHKGFHRSPMRADAAILGGEVGIPRPCRRQSSDAESTFEVAVAVAGLGGFDSAGGFVGTGTDPGPGGEVPRGGKRGHVAAGFGEEYLSHRCRPARDAAQQIPGRR